MTHVCDRCRGLGSLAHSLLGLDGYPPASPPGYAAACERCDEPFGTGCRWSWAARRRRTPFELDGGGGDDRTTDPPGHDGAAGPDGACGQPDTGLPTRPGNDPPEQLGNARHHMHLANRRRHDERTPGQRLADSVRRCSGSWRFIIIQTAIVAVWIAVNIIAVSTAGTLPVHPAQPALLHPGRLRRPPDPAQP